VLAAVLAVLGPAPVVRPQETGNDAPPAVSAPTYRLDYDVRLIPTERAARVSIHVGAGAEYLRWVRFRIDPARHLDFRGDGRIETEDDGTVLWDPPDAGGALHYTFRIDHLRDEKSYDARCAQDWALFRGDDLVPPARVRTVDAAESVARLRLRLPKGWSVAVPYRRLPNGRFRIDHPHRRFDRPTGWMLAGKLGINRERVAGVHVAVADPVGHDFRRLDTLALLRWTLPELRDVVEVMPDRLLVVGAGDPMWRGGLSGPKSLYLHADRPLIENDGTSPVLHELMHSSLGLAAGPGADWIVEGIAELYSLELLVRSKTISRKRFQKAIDRLTSKGSRAQSLSVDRASGAVTARAVVVLRALDETLEAQTEGEAELDDVVRILAREHGRITNGRFREIAEEVAGTTLSGFFRRYGVPEPAAAPQKSGRTP